MAAAHFEALLVDLQGDVHERQGAEENEQTGRDTADDGHRERGDAGGPRRVDGQLDAERHAGRPHQRQQPLDAVGGPSGPDVGVRRVLAVGVVPHGNEVTQVSLRGYLVAQGDWATWAFLPVRVIRPG